MSQPYPGAPVPYGAPYGPPPVSPYRPLRRTAIVSVVLMGLTAVAAVIQTVMLWTSYEDVKRFVFGLVSDEELERGLENVAGSGPLLDLVSYLLLGTAIAFVVWLWQARENTELFGRLQPQAPVHPQAAGYQGGYPGIGQGNGQHRHSQGWVVGSWVCPVVQFWYPLQVVQDVVRASEPPQQHPGAVGPASNTRSLLSGWWAAWTGFWVIIVGGSLYAAGSLIVWIVQLVDAQETSTTTGDYVDIYDLQDFMVRLALGVCIGFTIATALLIVAGVLISVVVLRVTRWQDERGRRLSPGTGSAQLAGPQQAGPQQAGPQLAGRQNAGPQLYGPQSPGGVQGPGQQAVPPASRPSFPSYGGYQHQQPPGGTPPWRRPD